MYGGSIKGQAHRDPRLYVDLTLKSADEVEDESWRTRFLFWDEIDDRGGELLRNTGRMKSYKHGLVVKLEDIAKNYQVVEERLERAGHSYSDVPRLELRRIRQVLDNYKL